MKILFTSLFTCALFATTFAQDFSYGFKAGLNFSKVAGDSEQDAASMDLEDFNTATGFHIGALFNLKFIDAFGLRGELMFSQKGTEYIYDGASYRDFTDEDGLTFSTLGNRRTVLNTTNSYIDVPLMAYYRLGKLELSAGPSIGILVNSIASGEISYDVINNRGETVASTAILLDYNYGKDLAGAATEGLGGMDSELEVNGRTAILPEGEGAYFEYDKIAEGEFYNPLDIGVNAQIAYFLNRGLFIAGRLNYGLSDATNNDFDRSLQTRNEDGSFIPREDADTNFSLQFSLGFSF